MRRSPIGSITPTRLTLDEMYDIFMGDAYKDFRDRFNLNVVEQDGKPFVPMLTIWHTHKQRPLLYCHIIAEQLLREDYREIDWGYDGVSAFDPCIFFSLLDLWLNPLTWTDFPEYQEAIIPGRYAVERYDVHRISEVHRVIKYIGECDVMDFANQPYMFDEDEYNDDNKIIYAKGIS